MDWMTELLADTEVSKIQAKFLIGQGHDVIFVNSVVRLVVDSVDVIDSSDGYVVAKCIDAYGRRVEVSYYIEEMVDYQLGRGMDEPCYAEAA
jgi:hypothetical protein